MKQYTIEVEETIADFLTFVAKSNNIPVEKVISDLIFNRVNLLEETISKEFLIIDDNDSY